MGLCGVGLCGVGLCGVLFSLSPRPLPLLRFQATPRFSHLVRRGPAYFAAPPGALHEWVRLCEDPSEREGVRLDEEAYNVVNRGADAGAVDVVRGRGVRRPPWLLEA